MSDYEAGYDNGWADAMDVAIDRVLALADEWERMGIEGLPSELRAITTEGDA